MPSNKNSEATNKPAAKDQAKNQPTSKQEAPQEESTPVQADRQSQLATILIGLLIIASGLLLYNYFQSATAPATKTVSDQSEQATPTPTPISTKAQSTTPTPKPTITPTVTASNNNNNQGSYVVQAGDSLWKIAEKVYGNGFDWDKINQANHLSKNAVGQPMVVAGQTLNIPNSAASTAGQVASNTDNSNSQHLTQTPSTAVVTYTVKPGDTLWSIAQAQYGKGNDWTRIYNEPLNNLNLRPDGVPLIHSGNILVIPQGS
jgi:nucleoid-associated protein YgaU